MTQVRSAAPSAQERIRRARIELVVALVLRAAVWTTLAALAALTLLLLADTVIGLSLDARARLTPAPILAALATFGWHLAGPVRDAARATDEAIALWFERRLPGLQYALVTQSAAAAVPRPALDAAVAAAPLERELRDSIRRALTKPALAMLVLATLLWLLPAGALGRVAAPAAGDALARPGSGSRGGVDPLRTIVVRVQPPDYTGLAATAVDNPASIAALPGSRVRIEGRGREVRALLGEATTAATQQDDRWQLTLAVPSAVAAVRLQGGTRERVLVLEPITDSVPTVRLVAPARDSVLREARGTVQLEAELRDDLGLADAEFEIIISAGSGELYTFRTIRAGARSFAALRASDARSGRLQLQLSLDTLKLGPGDLMHLRATARDRNTISGPGVGVSETRALRIARADEYDSVSVEPIPPSEPEKNALSQRMILEQTRDLVRRAPRLAEGAVVTESRRIAVDQTALRKRVGEVVFTRLGENEGEHVHFAGDGHNHGQEGLLDPASILAAADLATGGTGGTLMDTHGEETPIVALNRPLLDAYNHMWRASTELETGNPQDAIPWMERAIEALQRARAAERIYLRGRPPRVVVDLARVRLAGKDEGDPTARRARPPADPGRAARLTRFDALLGIVTTAPAAAADSLLLLRVALPADERAAAQALDAAAVALRQGGDVTPALAAARRALVDEPPRRAPLRGWGGG